MGVCVAGERRMYTQPVDAVLRGCEAQLRDVYEQHSGRNAVPNRPRFMCLQEFMQCMNSVPNIRNETLKVDDYPVIFALSKMAVNDAARRSDKENSRYPRKELTYVQ